MPTIVIAAVVLVVTGIVLRLPVLAGPGYAPVLPTGYGVGQGGYGVPSGPVGAWAAPGRQAAGPGAAAAPPAEPSPPTQTI